MKRKINLRLAGIAILAIFATMIGITLIYYGFFEKQVRNDLAISAKLLKETHYFETPDRKPEEIPFSDKIEKLRVTWIAADGTVLYDNDARAIKLANHADRPEIKEAFSKGFGESVRKSSTMNKNTYYYAVLLDNKTVIRVAAEAENIWSVMASAAPLLVCILLCIAGICVLLSNLLTRQLVQPIEIMATHIEDAGMNVPYKELAPFADMIRKQHMDILSAAKARQDFTANVSHELKTPLTAISGYAELLESGVVQGEKQQHFYQEIRKNAERLLALIDDTIRLSEIDRGKRELAFAEFDLCEVVKASMETLQVSADKKEIVLEFEGEPCVIRGNKDMIRELTENLVQNAIRYNNPQGSVAIHVSKRERPVLIVKDNGIGIPASEQERVFARFYRVDKSRSKETGGTGLGLAIVKHIVELHDAKIKLDSAPGVGTTIQVLF